MCLCLAAFCTFFAFGRTLERHQCGGNILSALTVKNVNVHIVKKNKKLESLITIFLSLLCRVLYVTYASKHQVYANILRQRVRWLERLASFRLLRETMLL